MRQRPAGATSTRDGEPLPGAEKKEATTRHRPAGATSTGDGGFDISRLNLRSAKRLTIPFQTYQEAATAWAS